TAERVHGPGFGRGARDRLDELGVVAPGLLPIRERRGHRGLSDRLADTRRNAGRDRRRGRHHSHLRGHLVADGRLLVPADRLALRVVTVPTPPPSPLMSTEAQSDPPMQWFIVNTFSGYENTVKKSPEDRIKANDLLECFEENLVPSVQVVATRG